MLYRYILDLKIMKKIIYVFSLLFYSYFNKFKIKYLFDKFIYHNYVLNDILFVKIKIIIK